MLAVHFSCCAAWQAETADAAKLQHLAAESAAQSVGAIVLSVSSSSRVIDRMIASQVAAGWHANMCAAALAKHTMRCQLDAWAIQNSGSGSRWLAVSSGNHLKRSTMP